MKKLILSFIFTFILTAVFFNLNAQQEDLLPSEVFYNENIAVNVVDADAPKVGTGDGGLNPAGPGFGNPGSGWVGSPIGDAAIPLLFVSIAYSVYLIRKRISIK